MCPTHLVLRFQSPGGRTLPALCSSHRNRCCLWSSSAACRGGRSHHQSCLCRRQLEEEKEVRATTRYSLRPNHLPWQGAADLWDVPAGALLQGDTPAPSVLGWVLPIPTQRPFPHSQLLPAATSTLIPLYLNATPEKTSSSTARVPRGSSPQALQLLWGFLPSLFPNVKTLQL